VRCAARNKGQGARGVYPTRDPASKQIHSLDRAPFSSPWPHLRDLLIEIGRIEPLRQYNQAYLSIQTTDVRRRIETGDPTWEEMVPSIVADIIKNKKLFGYRAVDDDNGAIRSPRA
jgi:hypothetical protein